MDLPLPSARFLSDLWKKIIDIWKNVFFSNTLPNSFSQENRSTPTLSSRIVVRNPSVFFDTL